MSELSLKPPLTISSRCAMSLRFLNEGLPEMGVLKCDVASHLGPFVLPPALWLHGKRAAHPAAVHRDRRRPPPATTCLLPGPPHHRQDRLHRQPRSHAIKHQNPGDPSAAWKQHESHVSALRLSPIHLLLSTCLAPTLKHPHKHTHTTHTHTRLFLSAPYSLL